MYENQITGDSLRAERSVDGANKNREPLDSICALFYVHRGKCGVENVEASFKAKVMIQGRFVVLLC